METWDWKPEGVTPHRPVDQGMSYASDFSSLAVQMHMRVSHCEVQNATKEVPPAPYSGEGGRLFLMVQQQVIQGEYSEGSQPRGEAAC